MRDAHAHNRGMGLMEIVVGSAIIITGIVALAGAFTVYVRYAYAHDKNVQAAYLAEEGLEVMSYLRDSGWNSKIKLLSTTTSYYLHWTGSAWTTTTTPKYVDGVFLRSIALSDVFRDGLDKIAASGTYDPSVRKIVVMLSYRQGQATTTQSMTTYITNLYVN